MQQMVLHRPFEPARQTRTLPWLDYSRLATSCSVLNAKLNIASVSLGAPIAKWIWFKHFQKAHLPTMNSRRYGNALTKPSASAFARTLGVQTSPTKLTRLLARRLQARARNGTTGFKFHAATLTGPKNSSESTHHKILFPYPKMTMKKS